MAERLIEDIFTTEGDVDMVLLAFGILGDQAHDDRRSRDHGAGTPSPS